MPEAPSVEVYTRPLCAYCFRALRLLDSKGVRYVTYDVWRERARADECRQRLGGSHTYPQVFIDGVAVGGFTELAALDRKGELDRMLSA
ncbi:MAG: glutaredoxin 3 [Myxococcales bacterium FL481]|nr:MAG: glutaredoxin 3 [Myxococcales bacterium FL481]